MHYSNQVQLLSPYMPSHVVLMVLILSCGMQGLVHPVARPAPSEVPVIPVSQLCPLYQTEAEEFVHWSQVFSSFIKAWAPAIILPGLSNMLKSQTNHWECGVMVGLCQSKHVLLSREAVLPSPACSHHLSRVSTSACISAQSAAPLSWFNPPYGRMIISAKIHWGAPTWGLKGKPAVDWRVLFKKPTPWLCVQSKSGALWSHGDTYLLCVVWTTHPALAQEVQSTPGISMGKAVPLRKTPLASILLPAASQISYLYLTLYSGLSWKQCAVASG